MIFIVNAIMLGWVAAILDKEGYFNIASAFAFCTLALVNAALAAPTVIKWVAP